MASRNFDDLQVLGKLRKVVSGSFQPNGASASVLGIKGVGFTVAHTPGANTYTITLQDTYFDYDSVTVSYQGPTVVEVQVTTEPDVKVNKTVVIGAFNSTTAAAINDSAFNANSRIHFQLVLKNTSGNF